MRSEQEIRDRIKEFEKKTASVVYAKEDGSSLSEMDTNIKLIAFGATIGTLEWVLEDKDMDKEKEKILGPRSKDKDPVILMFGTSGPGKSW